MRQAALLLATTLLASVAAAGCTMEANVDEEDPPTYPSESEHTQSNAQETAFNYFVQKGLTGAQSAGIVGNLIQESSVSPTIAEEGGGPGRGIAQWSVGGRWDTSHDDNLTWYSNQHGVSRWLLTTQLDFIWYELTTFNTYGYAQLKASTTTSSATLAFMTHYEVCGTCASGNRISDANTVLSQYGGTTTAPSGGGSTGTGSGTTTAPPDCYSGTLGKEMPDNACVESVFDNQWYQCAGGSWVDRWSDPDACNGVYPL
jgi:hypothetical protein